MAVQKCLSSIAKDDTTELAGFIRALREESQKPGIATSSAFVLLEWSSVLIQTLAGTPKWEKSGDEVILATAEALEKSLQSPSKYSIIRSALVVTRRAFRKLFKGPETSDKVLQHIVTSLTSKKAQPTAKYAVVLGVVAGVCARIPHAKTELEALKKHYYEFYTREIVSSRTAVPKHVASGLTDFFVSFTTLEDFKTQLLPTIEKGLLRSPEIILDGVLRPLVLALPKSLDLSELLDKHLLKSLLANIKSTNPAIRSGAVSVFAALASRSQDQAAMDHVAEELCAPLKSGKLASPDHRILHAEMLEASSLSDSGYQATSIALAATASKEGNESALNAEASALSKAVTKILITGGEIQKTVVDVFVKGVVDKKHPMRKIWLLNSGAVLHEILQNGTSTNFLPFLEAVIPQLIKTFTEITSNVAMASQNGLVVGTYVLTSLSPRLESQYSDASFAGSLAKLAITPLALNTTEKQPFMLSPRSYTKITSEEELRWLYRALCTTSIQLNGDKEQSVNLAWAEAVTYLVTATAVPPKIQREMTKELSVLYVKRPDVISKTIIAGLWNAVTPSDSKDKDSKGEQPNLLRVLRSVCMDRSELESLGGGVSDEQLQQQACSIVVLSRPELIAKSNWIDICLSMGLDPGSLAQSQTNTLLKEVGVRTAPQQVSSKLA